MIHNHDLKAAVDRIMDVFAGADGGVSFVMFCSLINRLDEEAKHGKKSAQQLLEIVRRFDTLLTVVAI